MDKPALRELVALGQPLFGLGICTKTWGANQELGDNELNELLTRHQYGDWSEMEGEDQDSNRKAVKRGGRIFSAYTLRGIKYWVITEADRSATMVLLPEEY
jgi:hypothetical protein